MNHSIDKANNGPAQPLADTSCLYIVATPIGNLQDITIRAAQTLKAVDIIACEDTRVSKKMLSHMGVHTPLYSYHEHNAQQVRPKLLAKLAAGESVALISDAGTPLISDPGYKLVLDAIAQGIRVVPIVGASSVMAVLMAAGLPTDQFAFIGFFPTQRSHAIELLTPWRSMDATIICFSTPSKLATNLKQIIEVFGECDVAIGREMTKLYEEFIRGKASEILATLNSEHNLRGELVLAFRCCNTTTQEALKATHAEALLADLIAHMPLKVAVEIVVKHTGQPRNYIYQRALALKK